MDQPAYVASESDGFTVESNAPEPVPAVETPSTADTTPAADARSRDEQGRFAAKAGETPEPAKEAEAVEKVEPAKVAKPRNDPEARISQAVARQREAERRADEAERRARDIEQRTARPVERPEPKAPAGDKFERFEEWTAKNPDGSHDDYLDARDAWRDERNDKRAREQQRQYAVERERSTAITKFRASVDQKGGNAFWERIEAKAPEVLVPSLSQLSDGEQPTWRHFVGEECLRADDPAAVIEYLADHPEDFQALASLPPRGITRRIAQIERDLARPAAATTGPAIKAPVLSTAKPPVRPVTGGAHTSSDEPPGDDADFDTHSRYWNAKERGSRRGR